MNFRDWFIIIGLVIMAGMIVDAARRIWLQRRTRTEIKFGLQTVSGLDEELGYNSELPNGGARVKNPERSREESKMDSAPAEEQPEDHGAQNYECWNNSRESVPETSSLQLMPASEPITPIVDKPSNDLYIANAHVPVDTDKKDFTQVNYHETLSPTNETVDGTENEKALFGENPSFEKTGSKTRSNEASMQFSDIEKKDILIIHVEARKNQPFSGDQLLQVFLDNGLSHGEMNVFHCTRKSRYRPDDTLFSVVNGMEPGCFDLKSMRQEHFSVLTFMMFLPGPELPDEAFKVMVDTIDAVSRHFFADVKDENRCIMTLQMLEHYRERVLEYQRTHMLEQYTG